MRLFLEVGHVVRLVSMRSFEAKSGRIMHFVNLANTSTYESEDFVLDTENCPPEELEVGQDYRLIVDMGRFTNCILLPLKATASAEKATVK